MTAKEFMARMESLSQAKDWEGIRALADQHYEAVRLALSDEERETVEGGYCHVAAMILEGRKRRQSAPT